MREKFAVAREGMRQLAVYIKDNPQSTWQDIAYDRNVSISTVCRVAKMFGLSRPRQAKQETGMVPD